MDNSPAGAPPGSVRYGRLGLILAGLAIAWYLVAEFLIWGAARAAGEQPPGWAFLALILLSLASLLVGMIGIVAGFRARRQASAQPRAATGLWLSIAATVIILGFWFILIPLLEQ